MAKEKIIKADDLKSLKCLIIEEIDHTQIQAKIYADEAEKQERSKQDQEIIENKRRLQQGWLVRGITLHECLVKIEKYSSEVEI